MVHLPRLSTKQGKRNPYFITISSYYGKLFFYVVRFRGLVACAGTDRHNKGANWHRTKRSERNL